MFNVKQSRTKTLRSLGRRLKEAQESIILQEKKIEVAKKSVALFKDKWESGEIDILEYIRSQNDLENAKVNLINQKTAYMELMAEYRFNVGR